MSTPAQSIADAVLLGSAGFDRWRKDNGCEPTCSCSVCWALERGLSRLNEALGEMKAGDE